MSDITKNSRVRREEQFVFINDNIIPSIQGIDGNYDIGAAPIPFLGMDNPVIQPRGPQQGTVNVSYLTAGPDQFIHLTGSSGFNGFVVRDKNNPVRNFSFTSGYLTSYRSACSVGEIPQNNVSILVLGDIGRLANNNPSISGYFSGMASKTFPTPTIASYGTIELNLEEFTTNRVLSYDINYQLNRNPIYSLGSAYPINVKTVNPIDFTATFELDVNDYVFNNLRRYPCNVTLTGLSVKLKEYKQPYNEIITYNIGDCILQSEVFNSDANGNVKGTLVFKSYLQPPGSSNEIIYDNPISQPPNPDDPIVQVNFCTGSTYYTGYIHHLWNGNYIYQIGDPLKGAIYLKCTSPSGFKFDNLYWFNSYTGTNPALQNNLSVSTNYSFSIYLQNGLTDNFCIRTPTGCLGSGIVITPVAPPPEPPDDPPDYIESENFEAVGYDLAGWIESLGTINPDSTSNPSPGEGNQYLKVTDTDSYITRSITAISEVWIAFKMYINSYPDSTDVTFCIIGNAGLIVGAVFYLHTNGTIEIRDGIYTASTIGNVPIGQWFYVWLRYTKGTGNNGIIEASFSLDGTKPTTGSNNYAVIVSSILTNDAEEFLIGNSRDGFPAWSYVESISFDKLRFDDVEIGSNYT